MARPFLGRGAGTLGLAIAALGSSLGACAPDRAVTGSLYPHEHRERHPIVLTEAPRTLDVFVSGPRLDQRQREDVRAFVAEYARFGQGPILMQRPTGTPSDARALRLADDVRAMMTESSPAGGHVVLSSYPAAEPTIASPIRLSFRRLQAKVAGQCGLFPQDLGGSDPKFNASNAPYWNLGCASQANLAAQVADPIDLVRGRPEIPGDTLRRTRDIEDLRNGKDPSTSYKQDGQNRITQGVGN